MKNAQYFAMTAFIALLSIGTRQAAAVEPSCPDLTCSTCVYIDIFDPAHTTAAPEGSPWILPNINGGKGVSVGKLVAGQIYLVTIKGRVSYWFKSLWDECGCTGDAHTPPIFYSDAPGAPPQADQTVTGYDWGCLFAHPAFEGAPKLALPLAYPSRRISIDGGVTYRDLVQLGGLSCSPDHTYWHVVVGRGQEAFFRITDTGPTYDNYGKYQICVQKVCCDDPECQLPISDAAGSSFDSSFVTNGVFDPRVKGGISDK
jgi:hypothetical protein